MKKPSLVRTTVAILATVFLAACASPDGTALRDIHKTRVAQLATKYGTDDALSKALNAADGSKTTRNQILNDFIFLIDMNYHFVERGLYGRKAGYDFATDFTATTLSSLSALSGLSNIKTTLSAIASGVTSTHASFSKNVLQDLQMTAVIYKMRAMRSERLLRLIAGMEKGVTEYPIEQGIVDLGEYYNAGTFTSAVTELAVQAAAEQKKNDIDVSKVKILGLKAADLKIGEGF